VLLRIREFLVRGDVLDPVLFLQDAEFARLALRRNGEVGGASPTMR
jgi:hypothetical protein